MRPLLYFGLIILAIAVLPFFHGEIAIALLTGAVTGFLVPLVDTTLSNFNTLRFAYYSVRHYREDIRLSLSYLYRIEDRGRYMLIMGGRYPQLQPVGGVYKLHSGTHSLGRMKARTDDLIPIDDTSVSDLRIRIPGRKVFSFMRWFESKKDRETSPWREFYEELIATGVVPCELFPHVSYNFLRRHTLFRFSEFAQCHEIIIADIFDLLPNEAQLASLREAEARPEVAWVTAEQIRQRGAVSGVPHTINIAQTAQWIL